MSVAASGILSLLLEAVGQMLADSTAFQTFVDEASSAAALLHIHEGAAEESNPQQQRPRAIIRHMDQQDHERAGTTGFEAFGRVMLQFERDIPAAQLKDYRDAYREFTNHVGAIVGDFETLGNGQDGHPQVTRIQMGPLGQAYREQNNGEEYFISIWQLECR